MRIRIKLILIRILIISVTRIIVITVVITIMNGNGNNSSNNNVCPSVGSDMSAAQHFMLVVLERTDPGASLPAQSVKVTMLPNNDSNNKNNRVIIRTIGFRANILFVIGLSGAHASAIMFARSLAISELFLGSVQQRRQL